MTTDPNAQFDFVERGRCPGPVVLGQYDSDGNYQKFETPVTGGEIIFGKVFEKPCRQIERRLTHGLGYDENSSMRQGLERDVKDDGFRLMYSGHAYLMLKNNLAQREQNSTLKNIWEHFRGRSL